jgi:hypothetical protein
MGHPGVFGVFSYYQLVMLFLKFFISKMFCNGSKMKLMYKDSLYMLSLSAFNSNCITSNSVNLVFPPFSFQPIDL